MRYLKELIRAIKGNYTFGITVQPRINLNFIIRLMGFMFLQSNRRKPRITAIKLVKILFGFTWTPLQGFNFSPNETSNML